MIERIVIPGQPISKHRPRFSRHGRKVVTYSDQGDDYERISSIVECQTTIGSIILGSVTVDMGFFFERPKSHFRTGRYAGILKDSAPELHIVKPDVDNCIKWILDIFNDIIWKDDTQVVEITAKKMYAEEARTEIIINYLEKKGGCYVKKNNTGSI